jgi:hypothetical protein
MAAIEATRFPVYFREEDLADAYALAAAREQAHAGAAALEVKASDLPSGWSHAEIERAYVESPKGMKLIFDGMIDHPDQVLDADDLARFLTHKPSANAVTVRGTMGAFANRCSLRYQRSKRDFPFEHWYVDGGFARYRMAAAVADILRPLRDR